MSPIETAVLERDHPELVREVKAHGPFDIPKDVRDAINRISTHVPEVPDPNTVEPRYTLEPKFGGVTEHTPQPYSLRTSFGELSPGSQAAVNIQRGLLSMSGGGGIAGYSEEVASGRPTVVTVFMKGDRTGDVMGGRLHKNEAGKDETRVSMQVMSTGTARENPQRRR